MVKIKKPLDLNEEIKKAVRDTKGEREWTIKAYALLMHRIDNL